MTRFEMEQILAEIRKVLEKHVEPLPDPRPQIPVPTDPTKKDR